MASQGGRTAALGSTFRPIASPLTQLRMHFSTYEAGARIVHPTVHVLDVINLAGPNLNPVNLAGGAVGAVSTYGFKAHSKY